jgi:hypothetical protein
MIPTFFIFLIELLLHSLNAMLPTWTLWPDSVLRGCVLIGQWSWWFSPWIDVVTMWQVVLFDAFFVTIFVLPSAIILRIFHLNIFKK